MGQAPGAFLRDIREKLGLGLRQVQEASARIAESESNPEFYISAARLTQIEKEGTTPSAFKLFSLSAIYGLNVQSLLRLFGLDTGRIAHYRKLVKLDVTRPVAAEVYGEETTVTLPVRLDPSFRWQTTHLVNRVVEMWGEVPVHLLLQFNPRQHMYGYIGLADLTMYPLIRPGSLVMIDDRRRRIARGGWKNEFERPIYFVELRDGYKSAWCQLEGSRLTLIPHPMSPAVAETFSFPDDAEVVGQVVGVAMRLVQPKQSNQVSAPRQPKLPSSET